MVGMYYSLVMLRFFYYKIYLYGSVRSDTSMIEGVYLNGYRLPLGNQWFPVRFQSLAMCRGVLSAVIAQLMS